MERHGASVTGPSSDRHSLGGADAFRPKPRRRVGRVFAMANNRPGQRAVLPALPENALSKKSATRPTWSGVCLGGPVFALVFPGYLFVLPLRGEKH